MVSLNERALPLESVHHEVEGDLDRVGLDVLKVSVEVVIGTVVKFHFFVGRRDVIKYRLGAFRSHKFVLQKNEITQLKWSKSVCSILIRMSRPVIKASYG